MFEVDEFVENTNFSLENFNDFDDSALKILSQIFQTFLIIVSQISTTFDSSNSNIKFLLKKHFKIAHHNDFFYKETR